MAPRSSTTEEVTLAHESYPDIISSIFQLGDIYTWVALRGASRAFRTRADALIFTHVGVFKDPATEKVSLCVPVSGAHYFPRTRNDLENVEILTLVGTLVPRDIRKLRALRKVHTVRIYHEMNMYVDLAPFNHFAQTALVVTSISGPMFRPLDPPAGIRRLVINYKYDTAQPILREDMVEVPYSTRDLVLLFTKCNTAADASSASMHSSPLNRLTELVQFSCLFSEHLDTLTIVGLDEIDREWLTLDPALDRDQVEAVFISLVASRMRAQWLHPCETQKDDINDMDMFDIEDRENVEEQIRDVVACVRFLSRDEYRDKHRQECALVTEL